MLQWKIFMVMALICVYWLHLLCVYGYSQGQRRKSEESKVCVWLRSMQYMQFILL